MQAMPWLTKKSYAEIADARLELDEATVDLIASIARVARACVAPLRKDRADMERVATLLKEIQDTAAARSSASAGTP